MATLLALAAVAVLAAPPAYSPPLDDIASAPALALLGVAPLSAARLTFDQATGLAMVRSVEVSLARASATRLSADARVAAERANPIFNFTPDRIVNAFAGASPYSLAVGIALTLLRPGEGPSRRGLRDATINAASLDAANAMWRARQVAAIAYRDDVLARAAAVVAADAAATTNERLASGDRLRAAGYIGGVEHDILIEARGRARSDLAARTGTVARADAALAAAIGAPGRALAGVLLDPIAVLPPSILSTQTVAARDAIGNRLDIQASLARFRGTLANAQLGRALRHGTIAVGPAYTFDKGDNRVGFSVVGELPLYHGGNLRRRAAEAALTEAEAIVIRTEAAALAAVEAARVDIAARFAEIDRAQITVEDLARAEARAQRLLAAGSGDNPTVLDARARRQAAELAVIDAHARAATALAGLEDAVQRPVWPASAVRPPSTAEATP